jgi:hypothetical protein
MNFKNHIFLVDKSIHFCTLYINIFDHKNKLFEIKVATCQPGFSEKEKNMDTPVFKLYLAKPNLETMLMPQERIMEFLQKNETIKTSLGVRNLLTGSVWSDERYTIFGVELFPNWQAIRDHHRRLNELNWFQSLQSEVYLGVDPEGNPNKLEPLTLDPNIDWLAHIFVFGFHPQAYDVSEAENAEMMKIFDLEKSLGAISVLGVESRFVNEENYYWGIELYPSLEALIQKSRVQEQGKWWKYYNVRSFLGTIEEGELVKK